MGTPTTNEVLDFTLLYDDDDGDATIASTAHGPSVGGEDYPTHEIRGRGVAPGNHDGETGALDG